MPEMVSSYKSWQKRLQDIIRANNTKALKKEKVISNETQDDRAQIIFLAFNQLREMGFKIEEPRNFGLRHVQALVHRWEVVELLSASTLQKRLSILRGFCGWIGKKGMIGPTINIVKNKSNAQRSYIAKADKSWVTNGVDPQQLLRDIQKYDPYVGIQLKMMWAFGIRRKEAICFKPRLNDRGEFIEVGEGAVVYLKEGTKGGRERLVDLDFMPDADARRRVLDEAKGMVGSQDAHLGRPGNTLIQNLNRFDYVMRKFNLTKDGLGVTSHGLRHQVMNDGYEALTGNPSIVRGGHLEPTTADADLNAKLRMTRNAGHVRTGITRAYYG